MDFWDMVEGGLAVVGFFTLLVKAEDYISINGLKPVLRNAVFVLLWLVGFISWAVCSIKISKEAGFLMGLLLSLLLLAGFILLAFKAIRIIYPAPESCKDNHPTVNYVSDFATTSALREPKANGKLDN